MAVVGFIGFQLARRAHLAGDSISEVAAIGLMAVLLSPVAWIHHLHWMVVVIFAVLGADPMRDRRRLVAAAVVTGFFLCRMPWWGITWLSHPDWPSGSAGCCRTPTPSGPCSPSPCCGGRCTARRRTRHTEVGAGTRRGQVAS